MTHEEFYNKVVAAARNAKGYEHLGYSVTLQLEKFRLEEEAAQHSVHPTVLCTCLYEVGGDDMSLNPDCPVHGSHSG